MTSPPRPTADAGGARRRARRLLPVAAVPVALLAVPAPRTEAPWVPPPRTGQGPAPPWAAAGLWERFRAAALAAEPAPEREGPPPGAVRLHGSLAAAHDAVQAPRGFDLVDDPARRSRLAPMHRGGLVAEVVLSPSGTDAKSRLPSARAWPSTVDAERAKRPSANPGGADLESPLPDRLSALATKRPRLDR